MSEILPVGLGDAVVSGLDDVVSDVVSGPDDGVVLA